jgi:hypothetical protein
MKKTYTILFFLFAQGASAQEINRELAVSEKILLSNCRVNTQLTFEGTLPSSGTIRKAREEDWFKMHQRRKTQRKVGAVVFAAGLALFTRGFIATLKVQ